MWRLFFYKGSKHLTLCQYECGMITLFDDKGQSVKIKQEELYEIFRKHLDNAVVDKHG